MARRIKRYSLPGGNYVLLCKMAEAGLSEEDMARQFAMKPATFRRLKRRDRAVKDILDQVKKPRDEESFQDYLYGHLTNKQRAFWDEIMALWKQDKRNAPDKISTLLLNCSRRNRQGLFVHALLKCNFNATRAGRLVAVPYNTYHSWLKSDPQFQALMTELAFHMDNFFESSFLKLVKAGNPAAVIHAVKSKLAHRGYGSTVKFEGAMTHTHEDRVSIEDLDLDVETRKKLLRAAEKVKALPPHDDAIEAEIVDVKPRKKSRG